MVTKYLLTIAISITLLSFSGETLVNSPDESRLNVKVDKGLELYFVTAYMSDSFFKKWITINDEEYAKEIENYFMAFKSHPAVKFFEETWKRDMSTYIPPEIMIYLSKDFDEQEHLEIPQGIIDHMGGIDKKNEFIMKIRDFAEATSFDKFFQLHNEYYSSLSSNVEKILTRKSCVSKLNEFYGTEQNRYFALLVPLLGPGNGYGPSIPAGNGQLNIYFLFSPYQDEERILNLVWHEFGHSFVNPLVAQSSELVNESDELFESIASSMQPLYSDWEDALSEHLVRVNTTLLMKSEYGKRSAKRLLSGHESQGFIYMKPLLELIEVYEENRNIYPTFGDYLPIILEKLKTMEASDYLPQNSGVFQGPMNSVSKGVTHIIIPTNEVNDEIEERIKRYAVRVQEFLQNSYSSEIEVITDLDAIEADLSGGDIWTYGTINGNLWLKKHISEFPFIIDANKLAAGKTYTKKGLRFITAWPNFENPARGVCIHTAQRAEDIIGISGVFHGPTDYIIIEGDEELYSGNYDKKSDGWVFK